MQRLSVALQRFNAHLRVPGRAGSIVIAAVFIAFIPWEQYTLGYKNNFLKLYLHYKFAVGLALNKLLLKPELLGNRLLSYFKAVRYIYTYGIYHVYIVQISRNF